MKRILSVILVIVLMTSGTALTADARQAAIEYTFSGADSARAGYAEGTVTLTAEDGGYQLYWADDSGALAGYYAIADVAVSGGRGSYSFCERVAIPVGATRLIAVRDGADGVAASFDVPTYKRLPYTDSDRLYRCAALSDIHIDCQDGGENIYFTYAAQNFARALNVAQERGAAFIITAGDQVTNASGATLEWLEYQRILAESDYDGPVYEAIGNHEMRYSQYSACDPVCGVEEFIIGTGLDGAASVDARKPYYTVTEPVSGDHFIFMALEGDFSPAETDEFSDEQIAWLESLLSRFSGDGHRIFLIQHALISGYGAGDDRESPAYGGSMTADADHPNNLRFKELIEQYRDVIWLSGHTHVDLRDGVNFSDEDGRSCLMFHIPSLAGTTRIVSDGSGGHELDRTFYRDATQGYLVDAYDGAVMLSGVNFYDDLIYPAYTYIVGETPAGEPDEPATEPEAPVEPAFLWGDADGDGDLSILDATAIQRHLAGLEQLPDERQRAAKVSGYEELNIFDATLIQRRLAGLDDRFPVEDGLVPSGAGSISEVKAELDAYYAYASYTEYAALKRAYRSGESAAMQTALSEFRALRGRVRLNTVCFSDSAGMGHPYAYAWNHASGKAIEPWPGQKTTYVRTNSLGQNVYAVTVDSARYDSIVFGSGESKTADIRLTPQSGRVYYPISDSSPYAVSYSVMNRLWRTQSGEQATVYFTDTEGWGTPNLYWWTDSGNNGWPGVKMTYVRKSSTGKSIYKATVPADAKVIFSGSGGQTADIPAVADGFGYYPCVKNSEGKWSVTEYKY